MRRLTAYKPPCSLCTVDGWASRNTVTALSNWLMLDRESSTPEACTCALERPREPATPRCKSWSNAMPSAVVVKVKVAESVLLEEEEEEEEETVAASLLLLLLCLPRAHWMHRCSAVGTC